MNYFHASLTTFQCCTTYNCCHDRETSLSC